MRWMTWVAAASLLVAACGGEEATRGQPIGDAAEMPQDSIHQAPRDAIHSGQAMQGEREFREITANWTDQTRQACGEPLRGALNARDMVSHAVQAVQDPQDRAKAQLDAAREGLRQGNEQLDAVRARLQAGTCDDGVLNGLHAASQYYSAAGDAAIRANQLIRGAQPQS